MFYSGKLWLNTIYQTWLKGFERDKRSSLFLRQREGRNCGGRFVTFWATCRAPFRQQTHPSIQPPPKTFFFQLGSTFLAPPLSVESRLVDRHLANAMYGPLISVKRLFIHLLPTKNVRRTNVFRPKVMEPLSCLFLNFLEVLVDIIDSCMLCYKVWMTCVLSLSLWRIKFQFSTAA